MTKKLVLLMTLILGICLGFYGKDIFLINNVIAQTSKSKENKKIFVNGHGVANTSLHPSESKAFQFVMQKEQLTSFTKVPNGKKLIITDFVYHPYGSVYENMTVNTARNGDIMFQAKIQPNKTETLNFCSGYEVKSGNVVKAWTDANAKDRQVIGVSVTGYLIDE